MFGECVSGSQGLGGGGIQAEPGQREGETLCHLSACAPQDQATFVGI